MGALLEFPFVLEVIGLLFGIFLPHVFNIAAGKITGVEPLHHELLLDFLCGLFFAICFHSLKETHRSRKSVNELTGNIAELITTSIEKNLTKDVDASIIKLLSQDANNDRLLGKLHVDVIHEYIDFVYRLNKNTQSIIAALTLIHICDFLKKLSDDSGTGVSLTHKQQGDITAILAEGRKTYRLFELFIGTGPDTWNKTFLQFVDSIFVRGDIAKEYTIIEDEKELTEQQRQTLRICSAFYRRKGFAVYFCQKGQIMKALNEISFRENVIEVYGNIGCFRNLPDFNYNIPKKFDCRYLNIENSPLENDLLRLVVKFREPMEYVIKRFRSAKPKPANLSVESGEFSKE
jgi:hypothetical protein